MNPQIRPTSDIFDINTLAVRAALTDLSLEQSGYRCRAGEGSSIYFLAGHLLSSRIGLLKRFGVRDDNPWADAFGSTAKPKPATEYPPQEDLLRDWDAVAAQLRELIAGLDDTALATAAEGFPIQDRTNRGALMFFAWHETYHVGQIGLLRTEQGLTSLQARLTEALRQSAS